MSNCGMCRFGFVARLCVRFGGDLNRARRTDFILRTRCGLGWSGNR